MIKPLPVVLLAMLAVAGADVHAETWSDETDDDNSELISPRTVSAPASPWFGLPGPLAAGIAAGGLTAIPAAVLIGSLGLATVVPQALVVSMAMPVFILGSLALGPVVAPFAAGRVDGAAGGWLAAGTGVGALVGGMLGVVAGSAFYVSQRDLVAITIMHTDGTDGGWGAVLMGSAGALVGISAGAAVGATVTAWGLE